MVSSLNFDAHEGEVVLLIRERERERIGGWRGTSVRTEEK